LAHRSHGSLAVIPAKRCGSIAQSRDPLRKRHDGSRVSLRSPGMTAFVLEKWKTEKCTNNSSSALALTGRGGRGRVFWRSRDRTDVGRGRRTGTSLPQSPRSRSRPHKAKAVASKVEGNNEGETPIPPDLQFKYQRSKPDANNHNIWILRANGIEKSDVQFRFESAFRPAGELSPHANSSRV
jgi:hypothetical protein